MNAAELMAGDYGELEWVVPDLLPAGQFGVITGKPKTARKSWLVDELALAATDGGPWMGNPLWNGNPRPTLLISNQDNRRRMKSRLRTLSANRNRPPEADDLLDIFVGDEWPNFDQDGLKKIEQWAEFWNQPTLVIIDILSKFRRIPGGYNVDSKILGEFASFTAATGITLVGVSHFYKGEIREDQDWTDKIQGSPGVSASLDFAVGITANKQGVKQCSLLAVGKDVEDSSTKLVRDGAFWRIQTDEEEQAAPKTKKEIAAERDFLLKVVAQYPGLNAPEIHRLVPLNPRTYERWTDNAQRHLLHEMWKSGQLVNQKARFYTPDQAPAKEGEVGQTEMWIPGEVPAEKAKPGPKPQPPKPKAEKAKPFPLTLVPGGLK